jgi:hypothetical protein
MNGFCRLKERGVVGVDPDCDKNVNKKSPMRV